MAGDLVSWADRAQSRHHLFALPGRDRAAADESANGWCEFNRTVWFTVEPYPSATQEAPGNAEINACV